ncbi:AAA family ATPase [Pikeienuella sp. HZG-20]|uniref:AAA family ATPase n=1 Tax=Paludibacillus litoralis TaxID=3133267 RepID=UPI0030EEAD22
MKLRALRLWNVRRFAGRGVAMEEIGDGVNVLTAPNEHGKSTSFDALHALFFQAHTSTAAAVRQLRPYSGGSPVIEADVETDAGLFRLRKQYYAGKRAAVTDLSANRLIAQADEAERWIDALVAGGAGGPAGLLWVRQGVTEMGGGTRGEQDAERRAREDVLTSVAGGEVEALTGGRRMMRALDRSGEELGRLVTNTGRPKAGGPYAAAIDEAARLSGEEDALRLDVENLRSALDERRAKRERLKRLTDPETLAAQKMEMDRAAAALTAAEAHASKLSEAEKSSQLAAARHDAAHGALETYRAALAAAADQAAAVSRLERAHAEAVARLDAARRSEEQAAAEQAAAEKAAGRTRAAYATAQKASLAAEATINLKALKENLKHAEEARRRVEEETAAFEALKARPEDIDALESLERRIGALRAAAEAKAAVIEIAYEKGGEGRVLEGGAPLAGGARRVLTGPVTLEMAGIGSMIVSPGGGEDAGAAVSALVKAERDHADLLELLDVESLSALRKRQQLAAVKAEAVKAARDELRVRAPEGLEALRAEVGRMSKKAEAVDPEAGDPDALARELDEAAATLAGAQAAKDAATAARVTASEACIRIEAALKAARAEIDRTDAVLGPADMREQELETRREAARGAARAVEAETAQAAALRAAAPDLESAAAAARRAASVVERTHAESQALRVEIEGLSGRIRTRSEDAVEEVYEEIRGRRQAAEERVRLFEAEVAALTRLRRALTEARSAARDQYFGPVMAELKPLLALLLEEASITFDDASLLPQSLERKGQAEDVGDLSGGMREQLTVLTRLAFARLLARNGAPVPVILDDALVYSDDDRIEKMFDALHRQARDLQIIVFTCRQRAFQALGGQGLRMIDWSPEP